MNENIRTRIALSLVPNIGAHKARKLMEFVDRPADVFRLSAIDLSSIRGIGQQSIDGILNFSGWDEVDKVVRKSESMGLGMLIPEDDAYSANLRQIADPPILLWYKGNVDLLNSAGIAVVGTRYPSVYGKEMAREFTSELVRHGFTINSGLARGIDSIAHKTALDQSGGTVAVLGSGIDRIYPVDNTPLADRIVHEGGLLVSEYPPGTKPDYQNFPTRNRIVSGLSAGILVVETKVTGGSMITARIGLEQNREIFVIPHALTNPRGSGSHMLIRESSGKLVENVKDITSEFSWFESVIESTPRNKPDLEEIRSALSLPADNLLEILKDAVSIHFDDLLNMTQMSYAVLNASLLELELAGVIRSMPGKQYQIHQIYSECKV